MTASRVTLATVCVIASAVVAVAAPVWTYAVTLGLFGLPHVLVELRYVDERFGARLPRRVFAYLSILLVGIAGLRASGLFGLGSGGERAGFELLLGVGLLLAVLPVVAPRSALAAWSGVVLCMAIAYAAIEAPLVTLVGFAFVHNLTPVGLLVERLRGLARRRAIAASVLAFGLLPLAIGCGGVGLLLTAIGIGATDSGPSVVGPLELHLGAFVPMPWWDEAFALDLFRAAAFLQCMHYAVVLHVLPRLGGGDEAVGATLRWPSRPRFAVVVGGLGLLFAVGFASAFGDVRAVYGVFAAVHAWVEIPVLFTALAVPAVGAGALR